MHFGRALVIADETTELATLAESPPAEPTVVVSELFRLEGESASLEVTTTHRGESAGSLRARLALTPHAEVRSSYLEFYAKAFPGIESAADFTVEDDEVKDVIVVRERYKLEKALKKHERLTLWAHTLASTVAQPDVVRRTSPLAVTYPFFCAPRAAGRGERQGHHAARARHGK